MLGARRTFATPFRVIVQVMLLRHMVQVFSFPLWLAGSLWLCQLWVFRLIRKIELASMGVPHWMMP